MEEIFAVQVFACVMFLTPNSIIVLLVSVTLSDSLTLSKTKVIWYYRKYLGPRALERSLENVN